MSSNEAREVSPPWSLLDIILQRRLRKMLVTWVSAWQQHSFPKQTLPAYKHCKYHIFHKRMEVARVLVCPQVVQLKREPVSAGQQCELVVNAVKTLQSVERKSFNFIHRLALSSPDRIDEGLQWEILPVLPFFKLSTLTKLDYACVCVCSLISWTYRNTTCCSPICM